MGNIPGLETWHIPSSPACLGEICKGRVGCDGVFCISQGLRGHLMPYRAELFIGAENKNTETTLNISSHTGYPSTYTHKGQKYFHQQTVLSPLLY